MATKTFPTTRTEPSPQYNCISFLVALVVFSATCWAGELAQHKLLTADQVGDALEILGCHAANRL